MRDEEKSKAQLIAELHTVKQELADLKKAAKEKADLGARQYIKPSITPSIHKEMLDLVEAGIMVLDSSKNIIFANKKAAEILSLSREELLNLAEVSSSWNIVTEEGFPLSMEDYPSSISLKTGVPQKNIIRGITTNDNTDIRWILINTLPILENDSSTPTEVILTFIDITEHKKIEQALSRSRQHYQLLVENQRDLLVEVDLDWHILYASPSYCKTFGLHSKQAIGSDFIPLIYGENQEEIKRSKNRLSQPPYESQYTERVKTQKGWCWLHWSATAVIGKQDKIESFICVGRNITEQKESEDSFSQLFNTISNGVAVYEPVNDGQNFLFVDINPAGQAASNIKKEDVIGKPITECFPNVEELGLLDVFRQVNRTGEKGHLSIRKYQDNRVQQWVENWVYKLPNGQIVAIYDDTSEQHLAQAALQESEERYRRLFETAQDAIFVANPETGRVVDCNPQAERMIGRTRDEILGMHQTELHPQESPDVYEEGFKRALQSSGTIFAEREVIHKDGHRIPVEISSGGMVPVGEGTIHFGIFRDISERRKMENKILEQARFQETLLESIPNPVFYKDTQGRYLGCNKAFEELFEIDRNDLIGKTVQQMWPERYSSTYFDKDQELFENPGKQYYEFQMPAKGGTIRDVAFFKSTFEDSTGSIAGLIGVMLDITERKRTEDALKRSENMFRKVFDILPVGLWIADKSGKLVRGNPTGIKIWGGSPLVSQHDYNVFKARRLPSREEIAPEDWALAHTVNDGVTITDELLEIDAFDGVTRTILNSTAPVLDENGELMAAIVVNQDITELKKVEQSLIESEMRARSYIDHAPYGVFITNERGEYLEVNPAACDMTGYSQEELCSMSIPDMVPEETKAAAGEHFMQVVQSGRASGENKFIHKSGEYRYWTIEAIRLSDTRFLGFTEDTTERKLEEERKQELERRLNQVQRMESVGRLAGGVAHDFNNLLTGITGNVSLALMELQENHPLYETLNEVGEASERAASLTRQLLAFSRKQIIEPKVVSPNKLLGDLRKLLSRLIGEDIHIEWNLSPDTSTIRVDPGQIEQVIVNLLVNARDAMPNGGRLSIETGNTVLEQEYAEKAFNLDGGKYVFISVQDSGHGMDEETTNRIFEPFFTTKGDDEGTGLGLATVFGIVSQHKGTIEVESELEVGTKFCIYLPDAEEEAQVVETVREVELELPPAKGNVLIVEDEPMVKKIAIRILKKQGFQVYHAESGQDALQLVEREKPSIDLLLTDIVMPNMNGRQLAEKLSEIYPEMKVLFTSGYTEDVIAQHGILEEGINFIPKPYSPNVLAKRVQKVMTEKNE